MSLVLVGSLFVLSSKMTSLKRILRTFPAASEFAQVLRSFASVLDEWLSFRARTFDSSARFRFPFNPTPISTQDGSPEPTTVFPPSVFYQNPPLRALPSFLSYSTTNSSLSRPTGLRGVLIFEGNKSLRLCTEPPRAVQSPPAQLRPADRTRSRPGIASPIPMLSHRQTHINPIFESSTPFSPISASSPSPLCSVTQAFFLVPRDCFWLFESAHPPSPPATASSFPTSHATLTKIASVHLRFDTPLRRLFPEERRIIMTKDELARLTLHLPGPYSLPTINFSKTQRGPLLLGQQSSKQRKRSCFPTWRI